MTLREFIELSLVAGNAEVQEYLENENGWGSLYRVCDLNGHIGKIKVDTLTDAGLDKKYLSYNLISVTGSASYKVSLVIRK